MVVTAAMAAETLAAAIPPIDPKMPTGGEKLLDILSWAKFIALAVCVLGLFAAGALMAVQGRTTGGGGEHTGKILMALGGVIVISAGVALVGFLTG